MSTPPHTCGHYVCEYYSMCRCLQTPEVRLQGANTCCNGKKRVAGHVHTRFARLSNPTWVPIVLMEGIQVADQAKGLEGLRLKRHFKTLTSAWYHTGCAKRLHSGLLTAAGYRLTLSGSSASCLRVGILRARTKTKIDYTTPCRMPRHSGARFRNQVSKFRRQN